MVQILRKKRTQMQVSFIIESVDNSQGIYLKYQNWKWEVWK